MDLTLLAPIAGGGVTAATITFWLQVRKARSDLTINYVNQFSSLEAHRTRRDFWSLVERVPAHENFSYLEEESSEEELHAFRYVVGYFTTAATLIENRLLNERLFFALSDRWMSQIFELHLRARAANSTARNFAEHRYHLSELGKRWDAAQPPVWERER